MGAVSGAVKPGRKAAAAGLAALTVMFLLSLRGNRKLQVNEYTVHGVDIPESFSGFRIAQIADLHCAGYGADIPGILSALERSRPDIIVITGDLVDSRRPDTDMAADFVKAAAAIAPVYFVSGNHEARQDFRTLRQLLTAAGGVALDDETRILERDGARILLRGLSDPDISGEAAYLQTLGELPAEEKLFTVLLAHRPEYFHAYAAAGMDLVLAGHAHGGQFRLPGIGGLFAPGQGFFPRYDGGIYREASTAMIVSRGLGDSVIPVRLGNPPELVIAVLMPGEASGA